MNSDTIQQLIGKQRLLK